MVLRQTTDVRTATMKAPVVVGSAEETTTWCLGVAPTPFRPMVRPTGRLVQVGPKATGAAAPGTASARKVTSGATSAEVETEAGRDPEEGEAAPVAVAATVGVGKAVPAVAIAKAGPEADAGHLGVRGATAVVLADAGVRLGATTAPARARATGLLAAVPKGPEEVAKGGGEAPRGLEATAATGCPYRPARSVSRDSRKKGRTISRRLLETPRKRYGSGVIRGERASGVLFGGARLGVEVEAGGLR